MSAPPTWSLEPEMTATPTGLDPRALQEAIDWVILLAEDDDGLAQDDFDAWLTASEAHALAWAHAVRTSSLIAQTQNVTVLAPRPARRAAPRRFALAGLATAAAVLSAVVLGPGVVERMRADYVTGAGQERSVTLADGSVARLAPGTILDVAYRGDQRRVRLAAGEAFFEVRPDPSRPFRVETGRATVTVLGTGFDVRRGRRGDEVGVRHGRVRVEAADGASAVLTAGDWIRRDGSEVLRGTVSPAVIGAWSAGQVVAVDRPLGDVVEDLERSFHGKILITDRALAGRSVTGVYDARAPLEALRTLVRPHDGAVRQVSPWLIVVSGG